MQRVIAITTKGIMLSARQKYRQVQRQRMIKLTVLQISSEQQQIICIKLVHLKTVICKCWQKKWTQNLEEQNHFQIKKINKSRSWCQDTLERENTKKKKSSVRVPLPWWKSNMLVPKSGHYVGLSTRTGERNLKNGGGWNIWTGEALRCWRWYGHFGCKMFVNGQNKYHYTCLSLTLRSSEERREKGQEIDTSSIDETQHIHEHCKINVQLLFTNVNRMGVKWNHECDRCRIRSFDLWYLDVAWSTETKICLMGYFKYELIQENNDHFVAIRYLLQKMKNRFYK